jgi:hypothetical protein
VIVLSIQKLIGEQNRLMLDIHRGATPQVFIKVAQNFSREKSAIFTEKSFWRYLFLNAHVG